VDDFMARVEVALAGYGFTGTNSIGAPPRARADLLVGARSCRVGLPPVGLPP
jgi:hypothetical protein